MNTLFRTPNRLLSPGLLWGTLAVDIRYLFMADEHLFSIKLNQALLTVHNFQQITVHYLLKQFHILHQIMEWGGQNQQPCHGQLLGPSIFKGFKIACLERCLLGVTALERSIYAGHFHRAHKDLELEKQAVHSHPDVKLEPIGAVSSVCAGIRQEIQMKRKKQQLYTPLPSPALHTPCKST